MDKNDNDHAPDASTTVRNTNNSTNNDAASPPPPSYAPIEGIQPAPTQHFGAAPLSLAADRDNLPFKPFVDGSTSSLPVLNNNNNGEEDVESGTTTKKKSRGMMKWHKAAHGKLKERFGGAIALIAVVGTILLVLGAVGGIIFGISVGSERGLTGEDYWSPDHNSLFRICESDSTSSKPFQLHTCNVFRPNYDLDAAPLHSFVESVRSWSSGTGSKLDGQARRIDSVRLDALLLTYGLKCSRPEGAPAPPRGSQGRDAQIVVGGVGSAFNRKKHATACNYWQDGTLKQDSCARYNDGGIKSIGKTHPLGINAIMRKHFDMTCEWVA